VQIASFALLAGMDDSARTLLVTSAPQRISGHIAADGSQPHELARTRSLSYSVMNLHGLMDLARLGEQFNLDLWRIEARDRGGIQAALDYLIEHAVDGEWDLPQITPFDASELLPLLLRAERVYARQGYAPAAKRLTDEPMTDRSWLLYGQP
jgi:hypothetical protein